MPLSPSAILSLQALRHALHRHPELPGQERETALRLRAFLSAHGLEPIAEGVGGHGLLYRLEGTSPGPAVLLRADIDGLPLTEASGLLHASTHDGHHHACGHDGHAAMLAGALVALQPQRDALPRPVLALFQPAEETAEGMKACLDHPALADADVARTYAFHNLPGAPAGQVLLHRGPAAPASTGLRITFSGLRSHASEPHLGRNPIPLIAEAVQLVQGAPARLPFGRSALATLVHISAGVEAYGLSPAMGLLCATLRSDHQADLEGMLDDLQRQILARARAAEIEVSFELVDSFPATISHPTASTDVAAAAEGAGLAVTWLDRPFPWSEDFGYATARWPGALIGLGAGEDHPALHSRDYDFPDALLEPGVRLWVAIATSSR